ncbi:MAG TPA: DivIVA domain-containing protein [Solirubrobacteraceae bacterium]
MSHFDRPTPTLDEATKPRTVGARLADFGDRLARTFTVAERPSFYLSPEPAGDESPLPGEPEQPWERIAARFPVAHEGYDRAAVDEHLSQLERELAAVERELAEVRRKESSSTAVADEISRIGEQTSTILMTAHEQAQEITQRAKTQADRVIADAATRARVMTHASEQRLRELDGEADAIWSERAQLIDDVRTLATALTTLADESARRFPPEAEKPESPIVPPTQMETISISRLGGDDVAEPHQPDLGIAEPHHPNLGVAEPHYPNPADG